MESSLPGVNVELASADLLVVGAYLIAVVAVGWLASRRISSSSDYALAGRGIRWPLLCGTLIGTTVGAAATMGNAGKAYTAGYAVLLVALAYVLGYSLMAWFAPRLRAAEIESLPDLLQRHYGKPMRVVAGAVLLVVAIPVVAVQLTACGLIITEFLPGLGLSFTQAVLLSAAIIVIYTLMGGLFAVAYTDLLQVCVMIAGIGVLLPVLLAMELGDAGAVTAALASPAEGWLGGMSPGYVLTFFPVFACMVLIDPSVWQRIAAASEPRHLRPALLLTAAFYGGWSLLVVALGVVASNLYPGLERPDIAVPLLVVDYLPPLATGLCLAAIIALIMSTSDSMLLIAGTTVSWDILRTLRPATPDRVLLRASRVTIAVVGLLGVAFALLDWPLFTINLLALGLFVCGLFVPVVAALVRPGAPPKAALAATVAGTGSVIAAQFGPQALGVALPVQPLLLGLAASAVAFVVFRRA